MIKWLDIVDQNQLQALLSSNNLQLNNSTRSFLESFAHLVNRASATRRKLVNAAIARKSDVSTLNSIIADEVSHLQPQHPHAEIIPHRHPETLLPIVYVRIQAVPELVVYVYRSYVNTRRRLSFGFRAYSFCRGPLTGPLGRAANYLRARCNANSWSLSASELISLWCQQVSAIPLDQRQSPIPPRIPPPKMMRRRREDKPPSSPPLPPDNDLHASLPHDHPRTNVVLKDDKLFPNRTFTDPEELYLEQVRAIRKKRKPSSTGMLDDYELAWKKRRRHDPAFARPPEQPQPSLEPTPQPQPPQPQAHTPSTNPSEPTQQLSPLNPPHSPESPDFSFHNPLSPELKQSSPPPPPEAKEDALAEQHAAKMEAAERAVYLSDNTPSSQPPHADTPDCTDDADDNTPPVFCFSSGVTPADTPHSAEPPTERRVREELLEKSEEGLRLFADKGKTESGLKDKEAIVPVLDTSPQIVSQRAIEEGLKLPADKGKAESGLRDKESIVPASSTPPQMVSQRSVEEGLELSTDKGETEAGLNDKETILPVSVTPPQIVSQRSRQEGQELSADRDESESGPKDKEAVTEPSFSFAERIESNSTKRKRERRSSDEVIIVDPDSNDGNNKKKRRLSTDTEDHVSRPDSSAKSPISIWPRDSKTSGKKETLQETATHELRPRTTKEVTREVTPDVDPSAFADFGAVSIPAGVDRDPYPAMLSEPSESDDSDGSDSAMGDHESYSDAGATADVRPSTEEGSEP